MESQAESRARIIRAWPHLVRACRRVLGSEQHYQAVAYDCLRRFGRVPEKQIGMNVKMWIESPRTPLFKELDKRKHENFRGGFEPIPDVVLFGSAIKGDWRRRNRKATLRHMLAAIEIKASERDGGRLQSGEVIFDIKKLAAHRQEKLYRHRRGFYAAVMVIDTAHEAEERMTNVGVSSVLEAAEEHKVGFFYLSPRKAIAIPR